MEHQPLEKTHLNCGHIPTEYNSRKYLSTLNESTLTIFLKNETCFTQFTDPYLIQVSSKVI